MKFVSTLLSEHLERYPRMELADVYKLLHQAALGSGHAVATYAVHEKLAQEIAGLGGGPQDPLIDFISPDRRLARVHLRAFAQSGHRLEDLAQAFEKTARDYPASRERLQRFCACLGDLATEGAIPFTREVSDDYVERIRRADFPAVHHSEPYRAHYRPAYRVVDVRYLSWVQALAQQ